MNKKNVLPCAGGGGEKINRNYNCRNNVKVKNNRRSI